MAETTDSIAEPVKDLAALRRAPIQRRSRERVERILSVASQLIAEKGSDQLKMSDVAELAGISIGSLYQYFPDKGAVIRTLAERYNAVNRDCIEKALSGVRNLEELCSAFSSLVDQYYEIFLAEPVMRDIWSGMQSDKQLADIELKESRVLGDLLAETVDRIRCRPSDLCLATFLIMHLGEATMRLAICLDRPEGDAVVAAYKRMALREISGW
jgi:AcrR family transcriptional regulator